MKWEVFVSSDEDTAPMWSLTQVWITYSQANSTYNKWISVHCCICLIMLDKIQKDSSQNHKWKCKNECYQGKKYDFSFLIVFKNVSFRMKTYWKKCCMICLVPGQCLYVLATWEEIFAQSKDVLANQWNMSEMYFFKCLCTGIWNVFYNFQ